MPVRRIIRRQVQKAPLRDRRFKRYRAALVNEFGRTIASGKSTITRTKARVDANTLLRATNFVRPTPGNPTAGTGGGGGGGGGWGSGGGWNNPIP